MKVQFFVWIYLFLIYFCVCFMVSPTVQADFKLTILLPQFSVAYTMTPAGNLTSCRPFQACRSPCNHPSVALASSASVPPTLQPGRGWREIRKRFCFGGHYQEVTRSSSVHIMLPRSWLQRILGNVVFSGVTTHSIVNPSYIKQRKNGCQGTLPQKSVGKQARKEPLSW